MERNKTMTLERKAEILSKIVNWMADAIPDEDLRILDRHIGLTASEETELFENL